LIDRYEEIIQLNKHTAEDKEKTITNLNQEIGKLKETLSVKERDNMVKAEEYSQQIQSLKGVNDILGKQYDEIKKEMQGKLDHMQAELNRVKPLEDIV